MKISTLAATMAICAFAFALTAIAAAPATAAEAATVPAHEHETAAPAAEAETVQAHEHGMHAVPPEGFGRVQALDPVTGTPALVLYFTEYDGRVIYFSSPESVEKFTSAPETYIGAVLLQTDWIQRTDPVSGKTARMHFFADYKGRRVFFASAESVDAFTKEPVKYLEKVDAELVPAQKTCPVMGGAINPKVFVDHEGRRIYFCCPACVEAFKKAPEKYLEKVDAEIADGKKKAEGGE